MLEFEKDEKLDKWDNFVSGTFLKAIIVKSENEPYVCIGLETVTEHGEDRIRLKLQNREVEYNFDLNLTNARKLMELGVKSPREIIGKKLFFKKVLVRNPKTQQEVDGLRIHSIENA